MATLLPRAAFVGRDAELEQLRGAFDASAAGQGGHVMLVGEPGIGKTALADQLVSYVISQGGRTLVGHCYEQGSLSLPYLPFIEALRSYVVDRDEQQLRAEAGSGAPYLAGIIPELGDRLNVQPPPPGEPQQDRLRLLAAVCDLLRRVSAAQLTLLVLEDLHDADRGTLDLLLFATRNLQNSRTLLVGTYRDVDVDRVHPLSGTLAELRRVSRFRRVLLRGLPVEDVAHLLREMRMPQPGWSLAEAIHQQTEGNPLFVQELVYYLASEFSATGRMSNLTNLPEGLRDVIGRRLSRLSSAANQALAAAAVIGREFRVDVLRTLLDAPEEVVEAALAEAMAAGIIQEQATLGAAVIYRFSHTLFRQALYEELIAPRRIRLHQKVARALEDIYGADPREHAAELAEHYAFSADPAELGLAVAYSEVAAQQAMRVYAYSEAEGLLQRALEVQQLLEPNDATRRCDLLLQLGAAVLPSGVPERVVSTVAAEAFALAESKTDGVRAARAAELALEALFRASSAPGGISTPEFLAWLERLERHAASDSTEHVLSHCWRGLHAIGSGQLSIGCAQLRMALERASDLGDDSVLWIASSFCITLLQAVRDRRLVEQLAFDAYRRGRPLPRVSPPNILLVDLGRVLLECGDRAAAEQVWRDQLQLTESTADAALKAPSLVAASRLAFLDGRIEYAAAIAQSVEKAPREVTLRPNLDRLRLLKARALHYLGRDAEIDLTEFTSANRVIRANRVSVLARSGKCQEALQLGATFGDVGSADDESGIHVLVDLFEASLYCRDKATAAALYERLSPLANRIHGLNFVSIGRLLGEAAVMLDRTDEEAMQLFEEAFALCQKIRFRPELVLIQLDIGELLLTGDASQRSRGIDQINTAIDQARAMKMQPSVDRGLSLLKQKNPSDHGVDGGGLTPREIEVASLLASGQTNKEIAEALVISESTAEVHVKRILNKLGLRSRSQVAAWASERSSSVRRSPGQ